VHGSPEHGRRPARGNGAGGISTERGHAAEHAPTVDARLERTLLLSLIVPGVFQIASGDRKTGGLLLTGYIIFWALAILYGVEIGVLAVVVWAIAILDSYYTFRKRTWGDSRQGS
ncbi:MAG TPA: hypothetical protein VGJ92_05625, partial [Methanocella sp.]